MSRKKKKFGDILHEHIVQYLEEPMSRKEKTVAKERMICSLLGKEIPKKYQKKHFEPIELFLRDIVYNYSEISESLSRLEMISLLIKQYPALPSWEKSGITQTRYLRYHYENFLNEVYLFKERVLQLLRDIKKKCKKQNLDKEAKTIKKLEEFLISALENISKVRGLHMHVRRYKNKEIEQLEYLELFSELKWLDRMKKEEYNLLRIKLSKQIIGIREDLDKVLNNILNKMIDITFKKLKAKYE